jgi:flavin-dependent thymidylate synthase
MAKVTLVSWSTDPVKTIAAQVLNMQGAMVHDLNDISDSQATTILEQLKKTKLNGALEFVDFTFQIEGVTRAFTHQLVRHRVGASYSQESLRFSAKTGESFKVEVGPSIDTDDMGVIWETAIEGIQWGYEQLLRLGAKTEDARGLLPTNILTNIGVKLNLKTLMNIAEVRLCHQAQAHWQDVVRQMKQEIATKVSPGLASLLVKACDRSGRCEFKAVFDRPCPVQAALVRKVCESCYMVETCRTSKRPCRAVETFFAGDWSS